MIAICIVRGYKNDWNHRRKVVIIELQEITKAKVSRELQEITKAKVSRELQEITKKKGYKIEDPKKKRSKNENQKPLSHYIKEECKILILRLLQVENQALIVLKNH